MLSTETKWKTEGEVITFMSPEFSSNVRVMMRDDEPYFVGKDVAEILGYKNASKALADHVDDEDKLNNESLSSLGQRGGWLINESGLYSLILSSKLPSAKRFKRWVTSEVLPQLRKTGYYSVGSVPLTRDEIALYTVYKDDEILKMFTELKGLMADKHINEHSYFTNSYSAAEMDKWISKVFSDINTFSKRSGKDKKMIMKEIVDGVEKNGLNIRAIHREYEKTASDPRIFVMCSESDILRREVNRSISGIAKLYCPEMLINKKSINAQMMKMPDSVRHIIVVYANRNNLSFPSACNVIYSKMNKIGDVNINRLTKLFSETQGLRCCPGYYISKSPKMMQLLLRAAEG